MTAKPTLVLAMLLLGLGGIQLVWSALSGWTGRGKSDLRITEVLAQVKVEVESEKGDAVRLLFPEIPFAVDQPAAPGPITVPLAFRSATSPTRVQVQVWRKNRVVLQSEPLPWPGGTMVDLGSPSMRAAKLRTSR